MSGKGWTDQELFRHWLKDHFVRYAVPGRPLLLILDGHSSHYEPVSVELARKEDIILFCLPPHTTQDSQPLDCTVFGPLKRHWADICHEFQQTHPGMVISKLNFSKYFAEAWLRALTPSNIIAGFRKCGIQPFNREAIPVPDEQHHSDVDKCDEAEERLEDHSGLQFTSDQISVFEKRYEEGYDIFVDQDYVAWLRLNHPQVVPSDHSSALRAPTSVLDEFGDVTPLDEIQSSNPTSELLRTSTMDASTVVPFTELSHCTVMSAQGPLAESSALNPATDSSIHDPSAGTFLPSPPSPPTATSDPSPPTDTSSPSPPKEKRKKDREAKKKQREEEKQRKAEERERKAEERARKVKEREDAKARKAEEKAQREVEQAGARKRRKKPQQSDCSVLQLLQNRTSRTEVHVTAATEQQLSGLG